PTLRGRLAARPLQLFFMRIAGVCQCSGELSVGCGCFYGATWNASRRDFAQFQSHRHELVRKTMNANSTLLQQNWNFLRARAVADDVAIERGYLSAARKSDLERLGFGRTQQLVPALVIPVWSVRGQVEAYQLRPDKPRLNDQGRQRKYEMKAG